MALEIRIRFLLVLVVRGFCVSFLLHGWWLARGLGAKRAIGLAPKTDEGGTCVIRMGSPFVPPATASVRDRVRSQAALPLLKGRLPGHKHSPKRLLRSSFSLFLERQ